MHIAESEGKKAIWRGMGFLEKLASRTLPPTGAALNSVYARDCLYGVVILATSVGLLLAASESRRGPIALLIIISTSVLGVEWWLPNQFVNAENNATRRLIELMKLLGRKDVTDIEKRNIEAGEFLEHLETRVWIRGVFLTLAFVLALGVIIAPVLFALGGMVLARFAR